MIVLDESVQSKQREQTLATYLRKALNTDPNAPKIPRHSVPQLPDR
jgi:hypothetical protein